MGPQVGMYLAALGLMLPFNSIQTFLIDAFFPYSAAAVAGATAVSLLGLRPCRSVVADNQLRSALGCILPEFAGDMFVKLEWGWGGTLLAGVALIAVPAPAIVGDGLLGDRSQSADSQMFKYGRELREKYQFEG